MKLGLLRSVSNDVPADLVALMQRVGRGDEQTFGAIYDQLSSIVYGVALRVVRNPAIAEEVAETIERAEDRSEVLQALDTLTDHQREALTLAYFGGNTYREVATLLGTPEGTVKTRIRDGLITMRDQLGRFQ